MKTKHQTILERLEQSLNNIRPYLEEDGGDVEVVELTANMELKLKLIGNCETCPMSMTTLKAGIEETILKDLPEIKKITAVNIN